MTDVPTGSGDDTWRWWEARRLRYNVALAVADHALRARDRRHQLERRGARHLDENAVLAGADRRPALAARNQADFAKDRALFDRDGDIGSDLDDRMAVGDREQR